MEFEQHPYVPKDLKLPGYVPGFLPSSTINNYFGIACVMIFSSTWILSGFLRKISKVDRLLMCWWIFTGLTHIILEGYYVFSPEFYKEKNPHFLAEVWKDYSKGDSKYAARDSVVVGLEVMSALLVGPTCLIAVFAIANNKPYSYVLQFGVSLGQLYGSVLYYVTCYLDGFDFSMNEYYFYKYFVFGNQLWILMPTIIIIRSWKMISAACELQAQEQTRTKTA